MLLQLTFSNSANQLSSIVSCMEQNASTSFHNTPACNAKKCSLQYTEGISAQQSQLSMMWVWEEYKRLRCGQKLHPAHAFTPCLKILLGENTAKHPSRTWWSHQECDVIVGTTTTRWCHAWMGREIEYTMCYTQQEGTGCTHILEL